MLNYDDTHLYLDGTGLNVGENRNGAVSFLGLDAMPNDVANLWNLNGGPQSLDKLHNLAFTSPMDLAIVLGDEYGDGTFPSFGLGSGYDFGQGVFAFAATSFVEVAGAQLSQFDGFLDDLTASDDDDANRESKADDVAGQAGDANTAGRHGHDLTVLVHTPKAQQNTNEQGEWQQHR